MPIIGQLKNMQSLFYQESMNRVMPPCPIDAKAQAIREQGSLVVKQSPDKRKPVAFFQLRFSTRGIHANEAFPSGGSPIQEKDMSNSRNENRDIDHERINVDSDNEVERWSKEWGVSEQSLRDAVFRVGPIVVDVKRALDK